jgi:NitT/TauT family transport system permease protein
VADFFKGLANGTYVMATYVTMQATIAAFCLGTLAALLTALVMTTTPSVERLLSPFIEALNALPRVALIPLFIIWFGLGMTQKVVSGVSIMYFVMLSYTLAGAKSRWRVIVQIVMPSAIPSIFAGMRLGMIYTVLGVITAELLAGGKGLGTLVSFYSNTFDTNGVFAVLIVLVLLTSVLSACMTAAEKHLGRWRGA